MTPAMALEWAIVLSGIVVVWLAWESRRMAWLGMVKLHHIGENGSLLAEAKHRHWRSMIRAAAGGVSMLAGFALLYLDDFALPAGWIAGGCWLLYQILLIVNLLIEWWVRGKV